MNIQPSSLSLRLSDPDLKPLSSCDLEKKATELSKYKVLSDESLGNLSCLPNELITRIFNYLGAQACKSLSLVSTHIFSLVGMQLPKVTFVDLSQPIDRLSAPALVENLKISSTEELEKGLALGIDLEKISGCSCKGFPLSPTLARTIEKFPALKQLQVTAEQFQFLLGEETFVKNEAFYLSCLSVNGTLLLFCPPEVKDNRLIVLAAIKNDYLSFKYASDDLKNDSEIALAALKPEESYFIKGYLGENLKRDLQFFLKAVAIDDWIFEAASESLKNNPELGLALLRNRGFYQLHRNMGEDLRGNKEFFLEAISIDTTMFTCANENLRNDPELALEALKQSSYLINYLGEDLKNDKEFFLKAISINVGAFEYASENLRNDSELALKAIKQSTYSANYLGEDLKNGKEFFLKAIAIHSGAFEYASENLRNDSELALKAIKQSTYSVNYLGEDLKNDKEFFLKAVAIHSGAFKYASENLRNDSEIALKAIKQSSCLINYLGEDLKNDKEFFLKAIAINSGAFEYASENFRNDSELALEAIKQSTYSINYLGEGLKNDKEFFLKAIAIHSGAFEYASENLRNDSELALEALKQRSSSIHYLGENLKKDKEFFLKAVAIHAAAFEYANENLRNDFDLALAALAKGWAYLLKYIGAELKDNAEFFIAAQKIDSTAINYASPRVQQDTRVLAVDSYFYSFILKMENFASWARQIWQKGWNQFKAFFKREN